MRSVNDEEPAMIRKLLSRILRAELEPKIDWSEIKAAEVLARQSVLRPSGYFGTDTLEQVLCATGDFFAVYTKWHRSGAIRRVRFSRELDGPQMRIWESIPAPNSVFRLQLSPVANSKVVCDMATPTWFGLWRNEPTMDELGPTTCCFDSSDRATLVELRAQLLSGQVPESLVNEEAMWHQINSLPEARRRGALASLVMQQHGEIERKFRELHPDAGPIPPALRPLDDRLQKQLDRIRQSAADQPPNPELAEQMKRFTEEIHDQADASKPT
jgi:hypothetical protein